MYSIMAAPIQTPEFRPFILPGAENQRIRRLQNDAQYSSRLLRLEDDNIPECPSFLEAKTILAENGLRPPTSAELAYLAGNDPAIFEDRITTGCNLPPGATEEFTATEFVKPNDQLIKERNSGGWKYELLQWLVKENGQTLGEVWLPVGPNYVGMHQVLAVPDNVSDITATRGGQKINFYLRNMWQGAPPERLVLSYGFFNRNKNIINLYACKPEDKFNGNCVRPMKGGYPKFEELAKP